MASAFADSPQGGKGEEPVDASAGTAYLPHTAKVIDADGPGADPTVGGLWPRTVLWPLRRRPEEPDVRTTSPVPWEGWRGDPLPLPD